MLKAHVFQAWDENERSVQPESAALFKNKEAVFRLNENNAKPNLYLSPKTDAAASPDLRGLARNLP